METKIVELKELYPVQGGTLNCMIAPRPIDDATTAWKRPAVIVVPGGAYCYVSKREGEPVAYNFLARGFHAFVLNYRVAPEVCYPEEFNELACAVDYVKKNADAFNVNKDEIFVVGFSAGGHLTANLAVDYMNASATLGQSVDAKPTAVGLCYPVISEKTAYKGSHENLLLGYTAEAKAELLKKLNLDEAVSDDTVPSFIWTTATDNIVPSENSLMFALQLAKRKIPYELHVYPQCDHGMATCDFEVCGGFLSPDAYNPLKRASRWLEDCAYFFRLFTGEKF